MVLEEGCDVAVPGEQGGPRDALAAPHILRSWLAQLRQAAASERLLSKIRHAVGHGSCQIGSQSSHQVSAALTQAGEHIRVDLEVLGPATALHDSAPQSFAQGSCLNACLVLPCYKQSLRRPPEHMGVSKMGRNYKS